MRFERLAFAATLAALSAASPPPPPSVRREPVLLARPPARAAAPPPAVPVAPPAPTASNGGPLVLSADGAMVAAVDEDADAVVILRRGPGTLTVSGRIAVGRGPAQALFVPGALWVLERGDGTLSAYDLATARRLLRVVVARDPVTMARSADGATLFVAATLPPRLFGFDARTGERRFATPVPREPRGLWVAPAGDRAVLSHLAGNPLSAVDLRGPVAQARALRAPDLGTQIGPLGPVSWWEEGMSSIVSHLAPSQAWSVVHDPRSGRLLVPMMRSVHHVEGTVGSDGYGNTRDRRTAFLLGVFDPGTDTWRLTDTERFSPVNIIRAPVASALTPGGELVVLSQAMGRATTLRPHQRSGWTFVDGDERTTLALPSALAIAPDGEVLVHSQADHVVEYGPPASRARVSFGDERLDPAVAKGRRLFLSANWRLADSFMACCSCHPDGRDDGITWDFGQSRRRTPTLAGRSRAPFGWLGRQTTLAESVRAATRRLRGGGASPEHLDALVAYIERGLAAPRAHDALSAQEQRGRRLFHEDAGCADCHRGEGLVDGERHALGGRGAEIDTPSLLGVSAGGPWFHDGRYATLGALLADPRSGMGDAHALAEGDRDDLRAWLETL